MPSIAISAGSAEPRSQWEPSSGTFELSQRYNCGPTGDAFIDGYYDDDKPSIENERIRAGVPRGRGTTYAEQARMLNTGGVLVDIQSLDHLERLVKEGRRPVLLAVEMGRVPYVYRGYSFSLWHTITAYKRVRQNGVRGWKINDSNFRLKSNVRRFYPDSVLQYAFIENWQSWAIVPHEPKRIEIEFDSNISAVNIRTSPDHRKDNIYARARQGGIFHIRQDGSEGKRLAALGHNFRYTRTVDGADGWRYARIRSWNRTFFVRRRFMHLVGG